MKSRLTPGSINHEAIEADAALWLARKDDAASWTEENELALQDWLQLSSAHAVAWLRLKSAWRIADDLQDLPEANHARNEPGRDSSQPVGRGRRAWVAGFSGLMGLAVIGLLVTNLARSPKEEKFVTAVGARQEVTLADGSHVTLNTRSRGRALVNENERKFWLESGEAFFEIAHDPKHPFVVTSGAERITVLGTKFSVRNEGGRTRVTVLEGRVKVERVDSSSQDPSSAATTLTKNDAAVAQQDSMLVATRTDAQTLRDLSWRQGRMEFENMPLREIAAEFNRYNRRQLIVSDDAADLRLSVRFAAGNIDGFVRLIQTGFGVSARTEGDEIYLSMH